MKESFEEKEMSKMFVSNEQSSLVLQPADGEFYFPTMFVSASAAAILTRWLTASNMAFATGIVLRNDPCFALRQTLIRKRSHERPTAPLVAK